MGTLTAVEFPASQTDIYSVTIRAPRHAKSRIDDRDSVQSCTRRRNLGFSSRVSTQELTPLRVRK
jgi:hypothetical protein